MATFTDLSQSTQAGDPLVSTLTSGLDRNQIAALEGDPTATVFIQAQKDSFTDDCVIPAKMGDQTATSISLTGIESIYMDGSWYGQSLGGTSNPHIPRRFNRAGKYRFRCTMKITNDGGHGSISNARIGLYKNPTSTDPNNVGGTLLVQSETVSVVNDLVVINYVADVQQGDLIMLLGTGYSHYSTPATNFQMEYRVFADHPSVEAAKTLGWSYSRTRLSAGFGSVQIPRARHIDWKSYPYPGDLS
jgi:hypothetical protein